MRLNKTFFYILLGWVAVLGMTSCADEKIAIPESLIPKVITVEEFNTGNYNGKLVQIEGVQFEESEGTKFNGTTSNANGNKTVSDCAGNTFLLFTSTSRDFANSTLPRGNGTITGVGSSFNGTVQLELRTIKDIFGLQGERCDPTAGIAVISIKEIRDLYKGSNVNIADDFKIKGVVTSDKDGGNITSRNIFIQDTSGGIVVRFTSDHAFALGDEIVVVVKGTELSEFNGLLQVSNVPNNSAKKVADGTLPTPETVTIDDLNTDNHEGKLVQIVGVTFTGTGKFKDNKGNQTIAKDSKEAIVYTRSAATFGDDALPTGAVTVVGHAAEFNGTQQVLMRNKNDIK
ncbi:DUF5689 domain-containing protein [Microscilla marina]|uniref:Lipoprotein, putative n=1 Tax=Microscilla marina ATCC 23134 TaxID=313606 RepID=A1ZWC7_MICM2|nr:DUF5689 domain-containing protein [Microscilla marina]EAY25267.1 lipoprotein, putative [Microscilla marina ATCC 23134]